MAVIYGRQSANEVMTLRRYTSLSIFTKCQQLQTTARDVIRTKLHISHRVST